MSNHPKTERVHIPGVVPHIMVRWFDKDVATGAITLDLATGQFVASAKTWDAIARLVTIYYLAMEERAVWLAELSAANPPATPAPEN